MSQDKSERPHDDAGVQMQKEAWESIKKKYYSLEGLWADMKIRANKVKGPNPKLVSGYTGFLCIFVFHKLYLNFSRYHSWHYSNVFKL